MSISNRILIIGGTGRIGQAVARDLRTHTGAHLTLTGRTHNPVLQLNDRESYQLLRLSEPGAVHRVIQDHQLVIHCAGPFRDRDHHVLKTCIEHQIPYMDVADSPDYIEGALALHQSAVDNNTIAILSTGVFPGISCSMVRQGVEQLDQAQDVHLSYLVAGSGGAGVTVMRTTFTELQTPFKSKQQGQWQIIQPYSDREVDEFPVFGRGGVYWFNTVETLTLARSFPELQTITTKFGSVPDFYNYLTWIVARAPKSWIQNTNVIEFLSQVSYKMTQMSDRFTGVGLAMKLRVTGLKENQPTQHLSSFYCDDTAICAGQGAGMIAQLVLNGNLSRPGVWSVEQILTTPQFETALAMRDLAIESRVLPV